MPVSARLRRLDLNLLLALEALLHHRSVTAAAAQLHVTQSTMSGSLARLREHFDDPLLVPISRQMGLTPLAELLLPRIRDALEIIEGALSLRPGFSPASAERHLRLCASEATVLTLLQRVIQRAEQLAPGLTFSLLPADPRRMLEMLNHRELDFAFGLEHAADASHPSVPVIHDTFHCMVWSGNRSVRKNLSLAQFLKMGQVVVRYGLEERLGVEEETMDRLGLHRRVEVRCMTPTLLGPLIVGTQRVATAVSSLARQQASQLPIKLIVPPFELPALRIVAQWHRSREEDPALRWFRALVLETSSSIGYQV
jgi:LysR family nod box-dependent transcriptional activator